jgi:hypothetical protein
MNSATGPIVGFGRAWTALWCGTAVPSASPTSRRCRPSLRATPAMLPMPNSYSRRIASNSSTVAFLLRTPPPANQLWSAA